MSENELLNRRIFAELFANSKLFCTFAEHFKKVRETWGRTNIPHVPSALYTSAFEMGHVNKWGISSNSLIFRVRVIGKSQSSKIRVSYGRKALPLPSRTPSARSGRGVRFLRTIRLLPSRHIFKTFGLPLKHLLELLLRKKLWILLEYFRLLR